MDFDPAVRAAIEQDLQRLYRRAEDFIAAHRAAVEAIASALAERRFLTADEAKAIVAANPPTASPSPVAGG